MHTHIRADNPFVYNMCGKTDFSLLIEVLSHAQLLLTNDTGTMHLAAYVGTRIVALGMSEVSAMEMGPLSTEGAVYLEPHLDCFPCERPGKCSHGYVCRLAISAEYVCALITHLVSGYAVRDFKYRHDMVSLLCYEGREDGYFYRATMPRCLPQARALKEIMRYAIADMWESAFDNDVTRAGGEYVYAALKRRFIIGHIDWLRVSEEFAVHRENIDAILSKAEAVMDDYLQAIQQNDKSTRKKCSQDLVTIDAHMMTICDELSFFADYYSLETRMIVARERKVHNILIENRALCKKMQCMLAHLEQIYMFFVNQHVHTEIES